MPARKLQPILWQKVRSAADERFVRAGTVRAKPRFRRACIIALLDTAARSIAYLADNVHALYVSRSSRRFVEDLETLASQGIIEFVEDGLRVVGARLTNYWRWRTKILAWDENIDERGDVYLAAEEALRIGLEQTARSIVAAGKRNRRVRRKRL